MPANDNGKSNGHGYVKNSRLKNLWSVAPWLQLKKEQQLFYNMVLAHTMSTEQKILPQVLQGMWQAYGQMKAARIIAWGAVATTGVLGVGLWGYQQYVSKKETMLNESKRTHLADMQKLQVATEELKSEKTLLHRNKERLVKFFSSAQATEDELRVADDEIKKVYGGKSDMRYQQYEVARNKAKDAALKTVNRKFEYIIQETAHGTSSENSNNPNKLMR